MAAKQTDEGSLGCVSPGPPSSDPASPGHLLPRGEKERAPLDATMPRVPDILGAEGLMEAEEPPEGDPRPFDLTRDPVSFPADRDVRLQSMARGDEGFLLGLGYSVQRGFGGTHPFVGEVRVGEVAVEFVPEALFAQLRDGGRLVVVEGYGNASQARLYIEEGGRVSERNVFNTAVKPLPGFRKAKEFVF